MQRERRGYGVLDMHPVAAALDRVADLVPDRSLTANPWKKGLEQQADVASDETVEHTCAQNLVMRALANTLQSAPDTRIDPSSVSKLTHRGVLLKLWDSFVGVVVAHGGRWRTRREVQVAAGVLLLATMYKRPELERSRLSVSSN